jgi:methylenetetrahydrofolate reductase (NADH)
MPIFTPGKRWQTPFSPFHKEPFGRLMLAQVEKLIKGPLFGCRMCGNCLLQETAFICPMACPKGLRNGPCGGSTPERCYVDESRPCIWYEIYDRSFKMGRQEMLMEVMPPLDWDKVGTETWGDVWNQVRKIGVRKVGAGLFSSDQHQRSHTWDSIFRPVRQPLWWDGDAKYHPPAYSEPVSELERRLKAGEFVVTTEIASPIGVATGRLKRTLDLVKPYVAAVNFTDGSVATAHMSSMACGVMAREAGIEPVFQLAARDRNRTAFQGDAIGASALGIHNVLCLTGDSPAIGPGPKGRIDYVDLESVQMIWILRRMRDDGIYLDGRKIPNPPRLFIGAAASPYASRPEFQALREHKKVNAGAQFFQTNLVFDLDGLDVWLEHLAHRSVLDKVYILIGITPLKSYRIASRLHVDVPGISLPQSILKRMEAAGDGEAEEGVQIALELIEGVRGKQGVNGIHLMAMGWEEVVPRIISEAGLLKPQPGTQPAPLDEVVSSIDHQKG